MHNLLTQDIWLILGAGISYEAPAGIPLWSEMKNDTIAAITEILIKWDTQKWHTPPDDFRFSTTESNLKRAISLPETAMESLSRIYLESNVKNQLAKVINGPEGQSEPNQCHSLISKLIASGKVKGIITPNFDRCLEQELESGNISYQVVMPEMLPRNPAPLPLYKVHGSIEAPDSFIFLRSTYLRGLKKNVSEHFLKEINNSTILICGYSGNDNDLFPILKKLITEPTFNNTTLVVDPFELSNRMPYSQIREHLQFFKETGSSFFARVLNEETTAPPENATRRNASLIPYENPFECAMFIADMLLDTKEYILARKYFYLADDIANDADDRSRKGIASIGRSLCQIGRRYNQEASDECERGRAMLATIDIENVESELGQRGEGSRMTIWLLRAKLQLAYAALSVALNTDYRPIQLEMVEQARHYGGINFSWGERDPEFKQTKDELELNITAFKKLIEAYRAYLKQDDRYHEMFKECLEFAKSTGMIHQLLNYYYVCLKVYPQREESCRASIAELSELIGADVYEDIKETITHPGEPFELEEVRWHVW